MALTIPRQHPYREFQREFPFDGYHGFNEEVLRVHSYPKEVIAFVQEMCSLHPDIYDVNWDGAFAEHEQSLEKAWKKVQENCPNWA